MVSLTIVAALSAIGAAGVRGHLAHAKSAEAIQSVGGIGRAVAASHANWNTPDAAKLAPGKGKPSVTYASGICADAAPVPDTIEAVKNRKYQPGNSPGRDYQTGDTAVGWRCLGYQNDQAQHYQLGYKRGAPPIAVRPPPGAPPSGGAPPGIAVTSRWSAYARGDVDGDEIQSWFILNGYIHKDEIVIASSLQILDQEE